MYVRNTCRGLYVLSLPLPTSRPSRTSDRQWRVVLDPSGRPGCVKDVSERVLAHPEARVEMERVLRKGRLVQISAEEYTAIQKGLPLPAPAAAAAPEPEPAPAPAPEPKAKAKAKAKAPPEPEPEALTEDPGASAE
jgi:hypothetical protein